MYLNAQNDFQIDFGETAVGLQTGQTDLAHFALTSKSQSILATKQHTLPTQTEDRMTKQLQPFQYSMANRLVSSTQSLTILTSSSAVPAAKGTKC